MEWGDLRPHANQLHSFISVAIRKTVQKGLLYFPVNVIVFTKQATLLWCARDFFL